MTLGNKIYTLRTKAGLSQEELAEQMGVSRQSVSKWETDASIPELDKLIQLSKLFEVTLDSLVQDEPVQTDTKFEVIDTTVSNARLTTDNMKDLPTDKPKEHTKNGFFSPQKIVGLILFSIGLLGTILSLIFQNDSTPIVLIVSIYCKLSGILCLTVKKRLGLAMGIMTLIYLSVFLFLLFFVFMNRLDVSFEVL